MGYALGTDPSPLAQEDTVQWYGVKATSLYLYPITRPFSRSPETTHPQTPLKKIFSGDYKFEYFCHRHTRCCLKIFTHKEYGIGYSCVAGNGSKRIEALRNH